ncbi:MAG: nitroreductase/quinone reductase family protein [Actinomycetota bacterium]|nr:nitroreductase/quinone reductase family protein [Actinomycetota bacterium]
MAAFRANAGRVGGYFADTPLLLLTTTGAKTAIPRTRPLTHLRNCGLCGNVTLHRGDAAVARSSGRFPPPPKGKFQERCPDRQTILAQEPPTRTRTSPPSPSCPIVVIGRTRRFDQPASSLPR